MKSIVVFVVFASLYHRVLNKEYNNTLRSFDDYSGEESEYTRRAHIMDLSGNVRKQFVLELGLSTDEETNIICSPLTAIMPLAKLLLGAQKGSSSEREILTAIGLKNSRQLNNAFKKKIERLRNLKGVEITLASKLYISNEKQLQQSFIQKSQKIFKSSIELIDTSDPKHVATEINEWVAQKTRDKIRDVVSENDILGSSLILVNCVYFLGQWQEPFSKVPRAMFYSPLGRKQVDMMANWGNYNYYNSKKLDAEILEIPYIGRHAALIIVLPNTKTGIQQLLQKVKQTPKLLSEALDGMRSRILTIMMPKFRIESKVDLKEYYQKMGIKNILNPRTSLLDGITKDTVEYLANGVHKTIIEVNEHGTEAAAASVFMAYTSSGKYFMADHPFLFYIRANNEQLFAGVVNVP